ncbi:YicC/YloC family endoribonuclease [Niabella drilacis]|uniref:TIGR00255 family protein n=1 Tax=Niabella drilacis (strain DSM 25811 / CCM 8410 / CCUG 62505 / LMG 26954 / E90) TaxID=1285928 RepID=A0A1G6N821_NIADE|nr:YicC/YloC family endoribonuclease [Niabella drilacis]SDC63831.1 TIGR00255 family protein [Niabella drilacis]
MFKSMTGFGRAEKTIGNKTFLVDIKSLNGKQFDLSLRLPALLKSQEFNIRKTLAEGLSRGSVECSISLKDTGDAKPVTINTDLAKAYYHSLATLSRELDIDASNILSALIKLPEVITPTSETLSDEDAATFTALLKEAIADLNQHRLNEGRILEEELTGRIRNIEKLQTEVEKLDPSRKAMIRENIVKLLEEKVGKENFDTNRLEQELIYYIEKIDITEELVRLKNHCEYFKQTAREEADSKGKKLSFILQEVGREINTTGSKAYHASIQKLVVMMKDELEKAKEQVLNVL